jgi:hypothetical protein
MDSGAGMKLCQPSLTILLVAIAGVLYHLIVGAGRGVMWWLAVGAVGTATFQALCYGGMEPIAWVLMLTPVLLVCFFLAVALFASSMRIQNVEKVPCGRCGRPSPCGCRGDDHHHRRGHGCPYCQGGGCHRCLLGDGGLETQGL